jgi:hypothetical protein
VQPYAVRNPKSARSARRLCDLLAAGGIAAGLLRGRVPKVELLLVVAGLVAQIVLFTYCAHGFLDGF